MTQEHRCPRILRIGYLCLRLPRLFARRNTCACALGRTGAETTGTGTPADPLVIHPHGR